MADAPYDEDLAGNQSLAGPLLNPLNWAPRRGKNDSEYNPLLIPISELQGSGTERMRCSRRDLKRLLERIKGGLETSNLAGQLCFFKFVCLVG
jgi:hypothetical protein